MKLNIKYMVSIRCKMIVKSELEKLGLHFIIVDLGEVEVKEDLTPDQLQQFRVALLNSGLELIEDKRAIIIENITTAIIEMVHYADERPKTLSSQFKKVTGLTPTFFKQLKDKKQSALEAL